MEVNDKVVLEMGMHGRRAYAETYTLMEYSENGQMNPVAFTADKDFAEAFINGKEEWPDDGVGVVKIIALTTKVD